MDPLGTTPSKTTVQIDVNGPITQMYRRHDKMGMTGISRFVLLFVMEVLVNIPGLFTLRKAYRKGKRTKSTEPIVACVGDNLDEVNGIAITSRIMLAKLREQNRKIYLFGVAFHSKPPRIEGPDQSVILAPGRYSMQQAGRT